MSQIHLLLFQKMGENLKYLVLFPDFNVLALLLHSIIFYVTGAGALSAWGDGPPQHPAEQGGRGLVSSLQVISFIRNIFGPEKSFLSFGSGFLQKEENWLSFRQGAMSMRQIQRYPSIWD